MRRYSQPDPSEYATLLARPAQDLTQLADPVRDILHLVRTEGDAAVQALTLRFDGVLLPDSRVSAKEIAASAEKPFGPVQAQWPPVSATSARMVMDSPGLR